MNALSFFIFKKFTKNLKISKRKKSKIQQKNLKISKRKKSNTKNLKISRKNTQSLIGGAADRNGQMQRGDRLVAVDGHPVTGLSHSDVIQLMSHAARIGHVALTLRRENENGINDIQLHNGSDKQTEFADGADMRRYHSNSTCKF